MDESKANGPEPKADNSLPHSSLPEGSMPGQRDDDYVETERDRRIANIVLLIFAVVVIGGGIWLANAMFEQRQLDECLARGRTNCAPAVDVPRR
jgi:hypothetical protein